jgi:hypothetical protein
MVGVIRVPSCVFRKKCNETSAGHVQRPKKKSRLARLKKAARKECNQQAAQLG